MFNIVTTELYCSDAATCGVLLFFCTLEYYNFLKNVTAEPLMKASNSTALQSDVFIS